MIIQILRILVKRKIIKNVETLCNNICSAVRGYYKYKGEKVFEDYQINIVDVKYESDNLRVR